MNTRQFMSLAAIFAISAASLAQDRAQFRVVDFDAFTEGTPLSSQFEHLGVTFSLEGSEELPIVCVAGVPKVGFGTNSGANDRPMFTNSGGFTDPVVGGNVSVGQDIRIDFDPPVTRVRMVVIDIDGSETVTLRAFADDTVVAEDTHTAGDPGTGDAVTTIFQVYVGGITHVVLDVPAVIDYAVDYLSFARPCSGCGRDWEIAQESGPFAGDFDDHILGRIRSFDAWGTTAAQAYAYSLGNSGSWNGLVMNPEPNVAKLFMGETSQGPTIFMFFDAPNTQDAGRAETKIGIAGDPDGAVRTVEDDPPADEGAAAYSGQAGGLVFTAMNNWTGCCTDGYALSGLSGNPLLIVQFANLDGNIQTPTIAGLDSWVAISSTGARINLSLVESQRVRLRFADCVADFNGDGEENVFDFLDFHTAAHSDDPRADLAPPFGVHNLFDYLAFQTAFGNGCE